MVTQADGAMFQGRAEVQSPPTLFLIPQGIYNIIKIPLGISYAPNPKFL
jgi:hypothetical protein